MRMVERSVDRGRTHHLPTSQRANVASVAIPGTECQQGHVEGVDAIRRTSGHPIQIRCSEIRRHERQLHSKVVGVQLFTKVNTTCQINNGTRSSCMLHVSNSE